MERDRINYLNSREYWELQGARGVYTKDHNQEVQILKKVNGVAVEIGIDLAFFAQLLGPECQLESEEWGFAGQHFHTRRDYEEWLRKRECDKVKEIL